MSRENTHTLIELKKKVKSRSDKEMEHFKSDILECFRGKEVGPERTELQVLKGKRCVRSIFLFRGIFKSAQEC